MQYFAGLFDAEGYVTLGKDGHFTVGTELTNEEIPNLLQETFGGKIYVRQRDKRKKTWTWIIATNKTLCLRFIDNIETYSIIKKTQLLILREYLLEGRDSRRQVRSDISHKLSDLKQPLQLTKEDINVPTERIPDKDFLRWLAGFFDGDGNFCIYEYQGKKSIIFDSWISVFNTFPEAICVVKRCINGSISKYKGAKFPIWKWVCCQKDSAFVCGSLYPFLRIKKQQCSLVSRFLEIKETKIREQSYSFDQINEIRDIIKQIKHFNSL